VYRTISRPTGEVQDRSPHSTETLSSRSKLQTHMVIRCRPRLPQVNQLTLIHKTTGYHPQLAIATMDLLRDLIASVDLPKLAIATLDLPKDLIASVDLPKLAIATVDLPRQTMASVDLPRDLIASGDLLKQRITIMDHPNQPMAIMEAMLPRKLAIATVDHPSKLQIATVDLPSKPLIAIADRLNHPTFRQHLEEQCNPQVSQRTQVPTTKPPTPAPTLPPLPLTLRSWTQ